MYWLIVVNKLMRKSKPFELCFVLLLLLLLLLLCNKFGNIKKIWLAGRLARLACRKRSGQDCADLPIPRKRRLPQQLKGY